ncbi:hypothetical protein APHDU1_0021 [Anaplasma phagocytophilum]|uniref:Uncharacterized protein n=1 Tax=Anaplasma phagocytophilum str. NCH-1 TaxID=1359161 RepID=A0A0F3N6D7_ANAPH|nr:hypothetical protein YYU_03035 [Anaplasma phagocytophilum str. HZ2]AGR80656.1 hypothetical protein WSQ_03035 [Anaplasma phagocytophilum str. JM]KJV63247.1 hypothetical protein EPHNCH_1044 [Anaplasma phagocytophilum str. NCH-1]KJZ97988.1 hypothetical protein APHDU1_1439 [Anaplasma phagocytophilum]AGR79453.1 hypothetical protein YYU_03435 [Anaplasma phagocytophilum str. HZ2]
MYKKGDDRENIRYIIGSSKSDPLPFLSSLSSTSLSGVRYILCAASTFRKNAQNY